MMLHTTYRSLFAFSLCIVLGAGSAWAVENAGQYLTRSASGKNLRLLNTSQVDMAYAVVQYDADDGTFVGCSVGRLDPREIVDVDGEDTLEDLSEDVVEVFAMRASKSGIGRFNTKHHLRGINGKDNMVPTDPKTASLPEDADVRDDVIECVCEGLDDEGLSKNLFRKFDIKC